MVMSPQTYERARKMDLPSASDPCEREYKIRCKVNVITKGFQTWKGQQVDDKMCVLSFVESRDLVRFLIAWLPEEQKEHFELVIFLRHPVFSSCRVALHRRGPEFPDHYFFVMSKGVEDELIALNQKIIDVDVLPASQDSEADEALETNESYDIVE